MLEDWKSNPPKKASAYSGKSKVMNIEKHGKLQEMIQEGNPNDGRNKKKAKAGKPQK